MTRKDGCRAFPCMSGLSTAVQKQRRSTIRSAPDIAYELDAIRHTKALPNGSRFD
jgi:hypothetical protein